MIWIKCIKHMAQHFKIESISIGEFCIKSVWYKKLHKKKNPHGKILHSFSKSNRETQMEICVLILSTPDCCKTSEKNWQFWICISNKYRCYASMCLWQSHSCCFDLNASKNLLHYIMKCMNALSCLKDCSEQFKLQQEIIILLHAQV